MGVSENWGTLFGGPYNKDPTIWGTVLGSPIFGNSHMLARTQGVRAAAGLGSAADQQKTGPQHNNPDAAHERQFNRAKCAMYLRYTKP